MSSPMKAPSQVRAYLAAQPPATRKVLQEMRAAIRAAAPAAAEAFSYRMPGFRFNDRALVWYAGWKEHVSLYPITGSIRKAFARELEGYPTATGTVRFPLSKRLPVGLIKRLVKARIAEIKRKHG